jgi:hypothetical protein
VDDVSLIREIECSVLDEEYKRFPLFREAADVATKHLLRSVLHLLRDSAGVFKDDPRGAHRWFAQLLAAFSHCLRWVHATCPTAQTSSSSSSDHRDEAALQLLLDWGMSYVLLAADHIAWTQGLLPARADLLRREITFGPVPAPDLVSFARQHADDLPWWKQQVSLFPSASFVKLFNEWQRHAQWTERGLEFDPSFVLRHAEFPAMRNWQDAILFPSLPGSLSLGSYSLGDMRHFLAAVMTTSDCIRTLEDEVDKAVGPTNAMGSWIFDLSFAEAVDWMMAATGLGPAEVSAILGDLIGDLRRFHFSITTTPIIRTSAGRLWIGHRLLADLHPTQAVARVLTAGSGARRYDYVSTLLESTELERIASTFRHAGLKVLKEETFVDKAGRKLTPDLIIWDPPSTDVLILDFKNSLAAYGAAEVANRVREYRKGILQVERYLEAFRTNQELLKPHIPSDRHALRFTAGLLFLVPMPLPIPKHREIFYDNWFGMSRRLHSESRNLLDRLIPKDDESPKVSEISQEIKVADWTYRRFRWHIKSIGTS